jgi:phosphate transport system substrate-binding protein
LSKNYYFLPLLFVSFLCVTCDTQRETITISGAFGLYPLAIKWAEEYNKLHPEVRLDISAGGAGKGMADVLYENVDIGMLSRDLNPREIEKGAFPLSVAKDAVIPTFNSNNPNKETILKAGISRKEFIEIFVDEKFATWGEILQTGDKTPLHVYTRSDAAGAPETWAKYLGKKQEDLKGVGVFGDPGLAEAVKNDKNAIGFNNVVYIYDNKTLNTHYGLEVVPIDLNDNGRIDSSENFYKTLPAIIDAIGKNKYPSPPARELYFVTKGKPQRKTVIDFLNWVLTSGQAFINESGYINLPPEKLIEEQGKVSVKAF